jgi:hypothetical protein
MTFGGTPDLRLRTNELTNSTGGTWREDLESDEGRDFAAIEELDEEADARIRACWTENRERRAPSTALHSAEERTEEDGMIRVVVAYVYVGDRQDLAASTEKSRGSSVNQHSIPLAEVEQKRSPSSSARRYKG